MGTTFKAGLIRGGPSSPWREVRVNPEDTVMPEYFPEVVRAVLIGGLRLPSNPVVKGGVRDDEAS